MIYQQYFTSIGKAKEILYRTYLDRILSDLKYSAINEKGVLAVAMVSCGTSVLPLISNYLRRWYGIRWAQCKLLIQILAAIDDPAAIQLLLSIANRFRTKGLQEEADNQVNKLAERKNWTRDELSDRTIPYAGLNEDGVIILDYGTRKFIARLNSDLAFQLYDERDAPIKSLPTARKDEDKDKVKEAKQSFTEAKAQLKQVLDLQRQRLYEAMCTQRNWRFSDWQSFLNRHPIIKHYCQRLIWAVIENDQVVKTFRPLTDGTLTDYQDNEISVTDDAVIRLAHANTISTEVSQAWQQHLNDYDVQPLFEQLGNRVYLFTSEKSDSDEIKDCEGFLLSSFAFRNHITKLGYTRGVGQEGVWYFEYIKEFKSLGLRAVISFTGSYFLQEDHVIALTTLTFQRENNNVKLKEVPPVLLSECYCDLHSLAALGNGFDPDWQKKVAGAW